MNGKISVRIMTSLSLWRISEVTSSKGTNAKCLNEVAKITANVEGNQTCCKTC